MLPLFELTAYVIANCLKRIFFQFECNSVINFYRAMLCRSAVYAGMRCPSVRLSVTFVSCVKTNKDVLEFFSPSGSQTILVFPCQTGWRYSDGNPTNGGVECRWGRQKTRFWTIVWLRCIQVDSVVNRTSRKL